MRTGGWIGLGAAAAIVAACGGVGSTNGPRAATEAVLVHQARYPGVTFTALSQTAFCNEGNGFADAWDVQLVDAASPKDQFVVGVQFDSGSTRYTDGYYRRSQLKVEVDKRLQTVCDALAPGALFEASMSGKYRFADLAEVKAYPGLAKDPERSIRIRAATFWNAEVDREKALALLRGLITEVDGVAELYVTLLFVGDRQEQIQTIRDVLPYQYAERVDYLWILHLEAADLKADDGTPQFLADRLDARPPRKD